MAKFTPKDPKGFEQRGEFELLPVGEYDFEVFKAEDETSKSGNDMIKLELNVFSGDRVYKVWDYLTFTEKALYKIHNFCKAVGLAKEYEQGELSAFHCTGKTGEVKIKIQKGTKDYPDDKNQVGWYVVKEDASKTKVAASGAGTPPDDDDDSIPF